MTVRGLRKTFRRRKSQEEVPAVADIDLDVLPGEMLVLLGPSGCGKTTLLRCVAGLETPDAGRITIGDQLVYDSATSVDVAVERRPASMVFQSYALWPHMSVYDNVAYALRSRRFPKREVKELTETILETVGVVQVRDQYPAQLSGGQQQRVSLARAVVAGQQVILFDEPLSNVDAKVRDHLRLEIQEMQQELGFTALYVTHDQEEAMTLGNRIAVLQEGQIAQLGTARELYASPGSRYVADFVGTAVEIAGVVESAAIEEVVIATEIGRFLAPGAERAVGERVVLMVRPEAWRIRPGRTTDVPAGTNEFVAGVLRTIFLGGGKTEYVLRVGTRIIRAWNFDSATALERGDEVLVSCASSGINVFGPEQ